MSPVGPRAAVESLHMTPLRSGPHTPFSVQVAELGPTSSIPGGQLNLIVLPSTGILSPPIILGTESVLHDIVHTGISSGCSHLAIYNIEDHAHNIMNIILLVTMD